MNVVAIFAHDHDISLFCAGTLLKYREAGHNVFIALTTGSVSTSAEVLNVPVRFLGFKEGQLHDGMAERAAVLTTMRWAEADIILTNCLHDPDSDHAHTAKLVADSMLIVSGKLHPADLPPVQKTPHVFYSDSLAGLTEERSYALSYGTIGTQTYYLTPGVHSNEKFAPEAYVDVSAYIEQKLQLVQDDPALYNTCITQARMLGVQMGCMYAECFTGHRVTGHIADYRKLP